MRARSIRSRFPCDRRDPLDCDEQAMKALVTAGAYVALADGWIDPAERAEAVSYIDRRLIAPSIPRERIASFFDERARRLQDSDFAQLMIDALRPVAGLSLTTDVIRVAERVAAADGRVYPGEAHAITLIRLITLAAPEPKLACPPSWRH